MSYRHFSLECRCGQRPNHIDEVGVTDDHELVIHWWCEQCKKVVYASKTLADCWNEAPPPDAPRGDFDKTFLSQLGISAG